MVSYGNFVISKYIIGIFKIGNFVILYIKVIFR